MEERISNFISVNENLDNSSIENDGAARFIHHQVIYRKGGPSPGNIKERGVHHQVI